MWRPANRPRPATTSSGHEASARKKSMRATSEPGNQPNKSRRRELTGGKVLLWLVAFFGVVFAVNGVLVHAAISTFGGVETLSSYKAGLQFEQEAGLAQRQDAPHWQVSG